MTSKGLWLLLAFSILFLIVFSTAGCGGNVGINSGGNGGGLNCGGCGAVPYPVTVTLAGSSTCSAPRYSTDHIYVTVAGVQLNKSATATADSDSWADVVPALKSTPKQIDLFNLTTGNLGIGEAKVGTYGSVRFLLAPNTTIPANNRCGSAGANCWVSGTTVFPLDVTAESTRGIVINQAKMASDGISIGSSSNLNVLFDGCASLESGRLLPKATAWSGAIQTYGISFKNALTGDAITPTNVLVAMEKTDASGVDRVIAEGGANATGTVSMIGPAGPLDFVVDGQNFANGSFVTYAPLVITGVGTAGAPTTFVVGLTELPITQQPQPMTQRVESGSTAIDFRISLLQQAQVGGTTTPFFTVPIFGSISSELTSETFNCTGTFCNPENFTVAAQPLLVQSGATGTPVLSTAPVAYKVEVDAFRQKSAGAPNCTSPSISSTVTVTSPGTITMPTAQFTGCQ